MDSLISPSNSLSLPLPENLLFDANLLDLKHLLKLQSAALPDLAAALNLPKEIITSPDELNSTLQSLLSNEPNSKKNDFDHRLSKLHEIEQINKAGLYNVLQQSLKAQGADSPKGVFPPLQITPSNKRRPDEQNHELSPNEEVYIRKKIKPGSEGDAKKQALNIVITQPPPLDTGNSTSNLKLCTGLFSQNLTKSGNNNTGITEDQKDVPQNVLTFKLDEDKNSKEFLYLVEWKPRKDGTCLNNSYLSKSEIMKSDPNLLVNFYEDQMLKLMSAIKQ